MTSAPITSPGSDATSNPVTSPGSDATPVPVTSTPSETSDPTPSDPITSRLSLARDRLLHHGFYLGDSSIIDKLHWVQDGRGHALTSISIPDSNADVDVLITVPPVELPSDNSLTTSPDHATLTAIVRVDRNDFWLTSDGGYQGPTAVCKELLQVKPSCALTDPATMPVSADFAVVLETLHLITEKCVTPGYSAGASFFSTDGDGGPRFKLRHKLFECIDGGDDGVGESVEDKGAGIKMEDWPLTKEKNRAELLALSSTHRILPLPAYDLAGNLIRPAAYRRCLQGAIVEVHFTLSHWGIAKAKRDVYGGEIQLMRVLVPPSTPSFPSKKRKLPQHIDSDDMPAAKTAKT